MDLASEAVDDKAHMFASFASVSWVPPRRVGQTPQIEYRGRELLVGFLRRQTEGEGLQRFVARCGQQEVEKVKEDADGKKVFNIPGAEKAGKTED